MMGNSERRERIYVLDPQLALMLLNPLRMCQGAAHLALPMYDLPRGARIVNVWYDPVYRGFLIAVEHHSFDVVPPGGAPPMETGLHHPEAIVQVDCDVKIRDLDGTLRSAREVEKDVDRTVKFRFPKEFALRQQAAEERRVRERKDDVLESLIEPRGDIVWSTPTRWTILDERPDHAPDCTCAITAGGRQPTADCPMHKGA